MHHKPESLHHGTSDASFISFCQPRSLLCILRCVLRTLALLDLADGFLAWGTADVWGLMTLWGGVSWAPQGAE